MRLLKDIDAEITACSLRLVELNAERRAAIRGRIEEVCRLFDGGMPVKDIAKQLRLQRGAIAGILWREGRTQTGRRHARARIREYVGRDSAESAL